MSAHPGGEGGLGEGGAGERGAGGGSAGGERVSGAGCAGDGVTVALLTEDAACLRACVAAHGVALFPADTVYGLGCDPDSEVAVHRLYELKGRPPERPAAVMFFHLDAALCALPELGPRTCAALTALLPGPLTLLLPNPRHRYPLACGPDPRAHDTLGLRVPRLPDQIAALGAFAGPLLQSSANRSGEPDCRRLADVPDSIRAGADLVLDGGELPGVASTVLDLRAYERSGGWRVVRAGPLREADLRSVLDRGAGSG